MLKKRLILLAFLAFTAIGLLFLPQRAFAKDVYMGVNEDGYDVYLMTETIKREFNIEARTKSVSDGVMRKEDYWFFWFDPYNGKWTVQTAKIKRAYGGPIDIRKSELGQRILNYCLDYLAQ